MIELLIENQNVNIYFMEKVPSRDISTVQYICKLFQILVRLLKNIFGSLKEHIKLFY